MVPQRKALSLRAVLGAMLLAGVHFAVGPFIDGPVRPNFLIIAVLTIVVRVQPGMAAVIGLLTGAVVDALAPSGFGAAMLAYTAVAYLASWATASFVADQLALLAGFMFAGAWLGDLVYLVAGGGSYEALPVLARLLWSMLSAVLTALIAVVLQAIFQPAAPARTR